MLYEKSANAYFTMDVRTCQRFPAGRIPIVLIQTPKNIIVVVIDAAMTVFVGISYSPFYTSCCLYFYSCYRILYFSTPEAKDSSNTTNTGINE